MSQLPPALAICVVVALLEGAFLLAGDIELGERIVEGALVVRGVSVVATVTSVAPNGGFRTGAPHPPHGAAMITCSFVDQGGGDSRRKRSRAVPEKRSVPWKSGDAIRILYDPLIPTRVRVSSAMAEVRETERTAPPTAVSEGLLAASCWVPPLWLMASSAASTLAFSTHSAVDNHTFVH